MDREIICLDLSASNSIDEMWAIEAERRIDTYDRGEINTISAKQVFEEIDRHLIFPGRIRVSRCRNPSPGAGFHLSRHFTG